MALQSTSTAIRRVPKGWVAIVVAVVPVVVVVPTAAAVVVGLPAHCSAKVRDPEEANVVVHEHVKEGIIARGKSTRSTSSSTAAFTGAAAAGAPSRRSRSRYCCHCADSRLGRASAARRGARVKFCGTGRRCGRTRLS